MGEYLQDWQKLPSYVDKMNFRKKVTHLRLYNNYCSLSDLELKSVREYYENQFLEELRKVNKIIIDSISQ